MASASTSSSGPAVTQSSFGASSSSPLPNSPTSTSTTEPTATSRNRSATNASSTKRISIIERFVESAPPSGMWSATGEVAARAPSLSQIRRGSFGSEGWSVEGQEKDQERRQRSSGVSHIESTGQRRLSKSRPSPISHSSDKASSRPLQDTAKTSPEQHDGTRPTMNQDQSFVSTAVPNNISAPKNSSVKPDQLLESSLTSTDSHPPAHVSGPPYPNGYQFPPKHTWAEATSIALRGSIKFVLTPLGFLITLYGLNVVAWGGMLFLLLINSSPAMCHPSCNAINSSRRIWIEIDSQILNALFCVTGFGLIPWRFRDFYYLLKWRIGKQPNALRRLAGIHSGWFRLPGSEKLQLVPSTDDEANPAVPIPLMKAPPPPLTGVRAPRSALWKLDFVIWMFVLNTFLQVVLSGFMWGLNRIDRPSWSTGTFVAMACIVAAAGGLVIFLDGKKVKNIEGVPVSGEDLARLKRGQIDLEEGGVPRSAHRTVVEKDESIAGSAPPERR